MASMSAEMQTHFNLEAYLARIAYEGPRLVSHAVLEAVHECHLAAIPFENFDVRLGCPIHLDLESIQGKLVEGRRGGYCFEQNALLSAALQALGFEVTTLEARVGPIDRRRERPRTHMLLQVLLEGRSWLADVGFGGGGPLRPVAMDGTLGEQPGGDYRVVAQDAYRVLQHRWHKGQEWEEDYVFRLEPAYPIDYELANYYTSTHPESLFVQKLTLQRALASARHMLRGRLYTVRRDGVEEVRELTPTEVVALVKERFAFEMEEEDVLRALGED